MSETLLSVNSEESYRMNMFLLVPTSRAISSPFEFLQCIQTSMIQREGVWV